MMFSSAWWLGFGMFLLGICAFVFFVNVGLMAYDYLLARHNIKRVMKDDVQIDKATEDDCCCHECCGCCGCCHDVESIHDEEE